MAILFEVLQCNFEQSFELFVKKFQAAFIGTIILWLLDIGRDVLLHIFISVLGLDCS